MYGKVIKKPVEIDWFKWEGNIEKLVEWRGLFESRTDGKVDFSFDITDSSLKVNTLEGSTYDIPEGYIIIRGVQGEYYPCDPEIFNKTYEIK